MRPIFGDKETIKHIDPFQVVLNEGLDVPPKVLGCANCNAPLHVEFDDYWIEGDTFGAGTLRWYCSEQPFVHDQDYRIQDDVMADEEKIVRYIQSRYPTFKHEC